MIPLLSSPWPPRPYLSKHVVKEQTIMNRVTEKNVLSFLEAQCVAVLGTLKSAKLGDRPSEICRIYHVPRAHDPAPSHTTERNM